MSTAPNIKLVTGSKTSIFIFCSCSDFVTNTYASFFTNCAKKEAILIFKEGVITRKITFLPEYFVAAKMTFSIGKYNVKRIIYSDTKPAKKYIIIG